MVASPTDSQAGEGPFRLKPTPGLGEEIGYVDEVTALLKPGTAIYASDESDDYNEKRLPRFQILLLCYARTIEPLAFFSSFRT
jgi:hypothetical protein